MKPPVENPVLRMAPTPSGYLHLGNAVSFVVTWALAHVWNGRLWLRVDDLDGPRVEGRYVEGLFRDLEWLELTWWDGPKDAADLTHHWSQRLRIERYRRFLEDLARARPGSIYGCTCSRSDVAAQSPDGRYPGTCRDKGLPIFAPDTAVRFRVPPSRVVVREWSPRTGEKRVTADPEAAGDFVVWRRDGLPAYHLASLCDDLDRGVNVIVRGKDLEGSTAAQLALAYGAGEVAKEFSEITVFFHHPLLSGADGEKMSKSRGAPGLDSLRELPQKEGLGAIVRMAAEWCVSGAPNQGLARPSDLVTLLARV